jgi:hypothetical protein
LALASIDVEKLIDFKFSNNSDSILHGLSNASNAYTWKLEGDSDQLKVERVGLINTELKAPIMLAPHDYVKDLLYVIGDKNKLVTCNNKTLKITETRTLTGMDKITGITIPKSELATVVISDCIGNVTAIDGRIGHEGKMFTLNSKLHSSQVIEMFKYGNTRIGVYGIEMMSRKIKVFDVKNMKEPIQTIAIDSMKSEPLLPYFDEDTGVCFAAENKAEKFYVHVLTEAGALKEVLPISLKEQVLSFTVLPKVVVNVINVEILRFLTLNKDNTVKVVSINTPKKNVRVMDE